MTATSPRAFKNHFTARPYFVRAFLLVVFASPMAQVGLAQDTNETDAPSSLLGQTHWRSPSSLAWSTDGQWLAIGNQRSGSISIIQRDSSKVVAEWKVAKELGDLIALPQQNLLVACDFQSHEVIVFAWNQARLNQLARIPVSHYPHALSCSADGRSLAVSSLWSRRLSLLDLPTPNTPSIRWVTDLDFAPQETLFWKDHGELIVADAFGGQVGFIDLDSGKLNHTRKIPAHKLSGLTMTTDDKRLVVSHQMLNSLAHTTRNDVHWGLLMSNDLRWLDLSVLRSEGEDFYRDSHMHPIGTTGDGRGDPAGVTMSPEGVVAVAVSGVNQVVLGREDDFTLEAVDVGLGPRNLRFSPNEDELYVVNYFDDTVSRVDVNKRKVIETIALGDTPEVSPRMLGERLFHDARLAHDGWMSCSSCHVKGHTNGQLNDNFSDAGFGSPKLVLSLLGRAGTEPLAWNGSRESFHNQIEASVNQTMQGPRPLTQAEQDAMVAYIKDLPAPPSLSHARQQDDPQAIERGARVFRQQDCISCHQPPHYTTDDVFDIELLDFSQDADNQDVANQDADNQEDANQDAAKTPAQSQPPRPKYDSYDDSYDDSYNNQEADADSSSQTTKPNKNSTDLYNPPSLLGVSQRGPYFHDGRADSLEEVIDRFQHQLTSELSPQQRQDLLAFLRSL